MWNLRGDDTIISINGKDVKLKSKSCNDLMNKKFKKYISLWTNLKEKLLMIIHISILF